MQLRSWTSTVTSTRASLGCDPLSRIEHTTNISSVSLQGEKKTTQPYEGKTRASSTSWRTILSVMSLFIFTAFYHIAWIISLHVKVNYIMYATHRRKYYRDSIFQLRQGKLQSQLIFQRSLTGIEKLSKLSSFLKCFPGSSPNKCSSSPVPMDTHGSSWGRLIA